MLVERCHLRYQIQCVLFLKNLSQFVDKLYYYLWHKHIFVYN